VQSDEEIPASDAHFGHGDRPFRSIVIAGVGAS
jgi:hypothetical protein